jgi:hypothetical protein
MNVNADAKSVVAKEASIKNASRRVIFREMYTYL